MTQAMAEPKELEIVGSDVGDVRNALVPLGRPVQSVGQLMPAMTIEAAVERYNTITEFVSRVMRREVDYGVIPGTQKLTLLKPGAEKLTTFFGLSVEFTILEKIEDWTGKNFDKEPFFYYLSRCHLSRGGRMSEGGILIAEADGSCNSHESKYRYRDAQRVCPECNQPAIIKGKEAYGGGWLCFRKKNGCGAKFSAGDPAIEGQQVGRVPNADIADQVNTFLKMSEKRSLIAATLLAVNASEFFTQEEETQFDERIVRDAQAQAEAAERGHVERAPAQQASPPPRAAAAPASRQTEAEKRAAMRHKRAQGIAAMGLVSREGDQYNVKTPTTGERQFTYKVTRTEQGQVVCNCEEFQDEVIKDNSYQCEHILAVKYWLQQKPDLARQVAEKKEEAAASAKEIEPAPATHGTAIRLAELEGGEFKAESEQRAKGLVASGKVERDEDRFVVTELGFKKDVPQYRVWKNEEGIVVCACDEFWQETEENPQTDYRCTHLLAVKFFLIQEAEKPAPQPVPAKAKAAEEKKPLPRDPLAKSLADLVTPKQIAMIRAIGRELGIDVEEECQSVLRCKTDELSKKAASSFISHLKEFQQEAAHN